MPRPPSIPALLLNKSDDAWGDERERAVMLEAYAYVFILATVVLWTFAAVAAWFVPGWVTIALFFAMIVPSLEWQRYCKARGVDATKLAYGSNSWVRTAIIGIYFGACATSMLTAAMADLNPGSSMSGGISGGVVGVLTAVIVARWAATRNTDRNRSSDR